jgi:hypothetical protein
MRTFPRETALYVLALLLGLAVRLIGLGAAPLSDLEAKWALQALAVAKGSHPALGSQPAYILLTSVLFFAYGAATNALARLIPALTGSALILVPALFKDRLKPRPALILAFALALEPGLVALSRQAGSSILALTFLLAAWGFWESRVASWAGVLGALALLSGPSVWAGLLILGLTWAIVQPFQGRVKPQPDGQSVAKERSDRRTAGWFTVGTIILGGTLFLTVPGGLGAWLASVPEYLAGWTHASDVSAGLMLFSLLAYQPLGLVLVLIASARGWIQGGRRVRRLSLWMLVGLLLALFYPTHQIDDLAWMLIPFWALASLELARSLDVRPAERAEVLGVVALSFLIFVFIWLDFLGLMQARAAPDQTVMRVWLMIGSFFLLVVSLLLVAVGWSIRVARHGAVLGMAAALALYSFAALMSAAGLRNIPDAVDLWHPGSTLPASDLLLRTVQQTSDWSKDEVNSQPVTIVGIDSPALLWLLRDRTLDVTNVLGSSASPPMVITIDQDNPTLAAGYRGQRLTWRRTPLWRQTAFRDWLSWLTFHQIPQDSEKLILWVRSDLFLDSTTPRP